MDNDCLTLNLILKRAAQRFIDGASTLEQVVVLLAMASHGTVFGDP